MVSQIVLPCNLMETETVAVPVLWKHYSTYCSYKLQDFVTNLFAFKSYSSYYLSS